MVPDALQAWWSPLSTILWIGLALVASSHVVLHKREVRSAAGWVGLIWLVPALGAALYFLIGINRIRRRAALLREGMPRVRPAHELPTITETVLPALLTDEGAHLLSLAQAIGRVTMRPLLAGNRVEPLLDGDEAYPEMLAAIEGAERSITLSTYIFETSEVGLRFVDALVKAAECGVEVRVLIDDVGARYNAPRADRMLRKRGVRCASFMPTWPWHAPYFNLRNHRKILVVDGKVGFTGGINIRAGHVLESQPVYPVRDLHFRVQGPVVSHMQEVFAQDWVFTTREKLEGPRWFPRLEAVGSVAARGIADGPDDEVDKFTWTLHTALAGARRSVVVMSPYFLPDMALAMALNAAALRGVDVQIVVPKHNNLRLVEWAMGRQLEEVLGYGCRVWLSKPPFEHTKLMVVDGEWTLVGSANWDTRSLRLNFEFDVECYDKTLASLLEAFAKRRMAESELVTKEALRARPLWMRVRDGYARLFMPYL